MKSKDFLVNSLLCVLSSVIFVGVIIITYDTGIHHQTGQHSQHVYFEESSDSSELPESSELSDWFQRKSPMMNRFLEMSDNHIHLFRDETILHRPFQLCSKKKFGDDFPITSIHAFVGSGSTWLRYLIEEATGFYTGTLAIICTFKIKITPGFYLTKVSQLNQQEQCFWGSSKFLNMCYTLVKSCQRHCRYGHSYRVGCAILVTSLGNSLYNWPKELRPPCTLK